jgi:putative tributyrin esterase
MALLHVDFFSDVLGMCVEMDVILPQATQGQIGMEGKSADDGDWPVLYLLHGMSDDHTIWQRRTSIERYVSEYGMAVVMPSTQLAWYTDMAVGQKWWTYISQELPAIVHSFFPNITTKREKTFAAGLSMGGYGALKCGLRAPQTFGAVASLSGGVDVATICENPITHQDTTLWQDIFGPGDKVRGGDNDLFAVAERLAASGATMPAIYMWCGSEDFLIEHNRRMRDHLTSLGVTFTYEESPGDHQWKYWDEKIQTVLAWLPVAQPKGGEQKWR